MIRTPRSILAAAAGVLLLAGLSGCGDDSDQSEALTEINLVFDNALTVCTDMPYEPFEYKVNGVATGFDMELARRVAEDLDLDLDVLDVSFDDISSGASLNSDTCDLAVSAISITGERARVIDFSSPYFDAKQALVTPADSSTGSLDALEGERVGVQSGTTGETYLRDFAEGAKVVTFGDSAELETALVSGGVAAAMMDSPAAGELVKKRSKFKVATEIETGEQYGMAVKKDGNLPLLRRVNSILAELVRDGTYDEIYGEFF